MAETTFFPSFFIICAGTPLTTLLAGTSFITTELGATITLSPIVILPMAFEPIEKFTLLPMQGRFSFVFFFPIITPAETVQSSPILLAFK